MLDLIINISLTCFEVSIFSYNLMNRWYLESFFLKKDIELEMLN